MGLAMLYVVDRSTLLTQLLHIKKNPQMRLKLRGASLTTGGASISEEA